MYTAMVCDGLGVQMACRSNDITSMLGHDSYITYKLITPTRCQENVPAVDRSLYDQNIILLTK